MSKFPVGMVIFLLNPLPTLRGVPDGSHQIAGRSIMWNNWLPIGVYKACGNAEAFSLPPEMGGAWYGSKLVLQTLIN